MTPQGALELTLGLGLLDARSVVTGDLELRSGSRRNHNLALIRRDDTSLFLKCGASTEGIGSMAHEAAVYRWLHAKPALAAYVPALRAFHPGTNTLVIEFHADAEDLQTYHRRRHRFPARIGAQLGTVLGVLHELPLPASSDLSCDASGLPPPWPLFLACPDLAAVHDYSAGNLELVKLIQSHREIGTALDALAARWHDRSLIHADLRWPNVILRQRERVLRERRLLLVDWEIARPGDPCWDIGSVFQEYLACWVRSMPVVDKVPFESMVAAARYPLERMQPALRRFWRCYVERRGLAGEEIATTLDLACRYAGARLLQNAFEQSQHAPRLASDVVCLVQLAHNILRRPLEAAGRLLGIALPASLVHG